VLLGNCIYEMLNVKCSTLIQQCINELQDCDEAINAVEEIVATVEPVFKEANLKEDEIDMMHDKLVDNNKNVQAIKDRIDNINKLIKRAQKIKKEIRNMKMGSVALVGQITTISKMRIYDPKYSTDVLSNIKLSGDTMDKINAKINELYIY